MDWRSTDTSQPNFNPDGMQASTTYGNNPSDSTMVDESPLRTADNDDNAATRPVILDPPADVDRPPTSIAHNPRRQGLYGVEAFGLQPQQSPTRGQSMPLLPGSSEMTAQQTHNSLNLAQALHQFASPTLSIETYQRLSALGTASVGNGGQPLTSANMNGLSGSEMEVDSGNNCHEQVGSQGTLAVAMERSIALHQRLDPAAAAAALSKAGTDLDRDEQGNLIRKGSISTSIFRTAAISRGGGGGGHQHRLKSVVNDNDNKSTKKRKHSDLMNDILPAPPFIWQGTTDPLFTAFQGFLLFPELCFTLVAHLPLRDVISLYSISRDFHAIIDTRFTTACLIIAQKRAPESARIFHFRMYAQLCRSDPANRIPHPNPIKAASHTPRMIPSFRWVHFILFREKVVHEIMSIFAESGVPLPSNCQTALKKMWLIMDIPDNARRIGLVHKSNIITDVDLYFMLCFVVRLDMLCHDPLAATKHTGLRKLMLSQRDGLLSVLLVVKRVQWKQPADVLLAWVRHACEVSIAHDNDDFDAISLFGSETIFGVPIKEAGLGKYEFWGRRGAVRRVDPSTGRKVRYGLLMRPDQLVMREGVRRRLNFSKVVLKSVLCCYVDDETLKSLPPRPFPRRIPEWNDEEYGADDLVGGALALDVARGGDPLLDLGEPFNGAPGIVVDVSDTDVMGRRARMMREDQEAFLDLCVSYCDAEVVKVDQEDVITQDDLGLSI